MSAIEKYSDLSPNTLAMLQASDVVEDVSLDPISLSGKQSRLMLLAALYPMLAKAAHLTNSSDPSSTVPEDIRQFLQTYQMLINDTNEGFEQLNAQYDEIESVLTQIILSLPKEGEELGAALKGLSKQFLNSLQGASSTDLDVISQFLDEEIEAITQEQTTAAAPKDPEPAPPQVNYKTAVMEMVGSLMTLSAQVGTTEAENAELQTDVMNDLKTSLTTVMTNQSNNIFQMTTKQLRMKRRMFFVKMITPSGMLGAIGHAIGGEKGAKIGSYIGDRFFNLKTVTMGPLVSMIAIALKGAEERYDIKSPKEHVQDLGELIGGDIGKKIATVAFELTPFGSTKELIGQMFKLISRQIDSEKLTEIMTKTKDTKGMYLIDSFYKKEFEAFAKASNGMFGTDLDPKGDWVDSAARWTTVAAVAITLIAIIALSIVFAPEALGEEAAVGADLVPQAIGMGVGEGAAIGAETGAVAIDAAVEAAEGAMTAFEDLSATFLPELFAEVEESATLVTETAQVAAESSEISVGVGEGSAAVGETVEAVETEATSATDQMLERFKTMANSFKEKAVNMAKNPNKLLTIIQTLMSTYQAVFDTMNTLTLHNLAEVQKTQGYTNANLQTMRLLMSQIQQSMTQAFQMAEQSISSLGQSQNISAVTNQALFAARALA